MIVGLTSKQTLASLKAHAQQDRWFQLVVKVIRWWDKYIKGKKTGLITKREWRVYLRNTFASIRINERIL